MMIDMNIHNLKSKIRMQVTTSPADAIARWSRAAKGYDEAKQNEFCARFHKMGTRAAVTLDNTKPKKWESFVR